MAYDPKGVKFVLTAPDTESTEQAPAHGSR